VGVRRLLAVFVVLLALPAAARADDVAQYVDPMIGTLAPGFVFPGADVPFGMVQNSPDTFTPAGYDDPIGAYSGYMGHHPEIRGFSLVHLSGPGVAKAGDLPFMAWTAPTAPPSDPQQYAAPFTHAAEHAEAGYYEVRLGNGTDVELTAATHAAMQRYSFPPGPAAYLIVDPKHDNDGAAQAGGFTVDSPTEISGFTRTEHYPVFFAARFSEPAIAHGDTWVQFPAGSTVTMRVAISFVDVEGARRNLAADAPASTSFDDMRHAAYAAWNDELSKISVGGGSLADRRSFYTALYHALLHPNVFTDVDGRYRGFDGAIQPADGRTHYANYSSWDTYKATNQLQALLEPHRYADMLRSLLADAQQGGHLPRWAEENYDPAHMSGDPAIPMIADGYCRGLIGDAEAQALYDEAVKLVGRRQAEWQQLGYLPIDKGYDSGTGTTLEYGVADFALALMAHRLGLDDDAQHWLDQSLDYR
jgi:putative alpha-1,2-mannosidase